MPLPVTPAAAAADDDARQRDPGYYLIGRGRAAFERSLAVRPHGLALVRRFATTGIAGYVGSVAFMAGVILFLPLLALAQIGVLGWRLGAMAIIGMPPAIGSSPAALVQPFCPAWRFATVCLPNFAHWWPFRRC